MPSLKKYQQFIVGIFASIALLAIGLAVLGISLFQANRQQAASIKEVSTDIINAYTQD